MNKVLMSGRLTKDAEVRTTAEGNSIARTTIAVDDGFGEKKKTYFINLVAFGKTAESMERNCFKGQRVIVDGRLQTGSYDRNGQTIYTTDVIIEKIEFQDWKDKSSEVPKQTSYSSLEETDIPF